MTRNPHIGSSFDNFLDKQGILEETHLEAIKRVLARQIQEAMSQQGLTRQAMADRMQTSRSQLDRLLKADAGNVQIDTLVRAAEAVGRKLRVELI